MTEYYYGLAGLMFVVIGVFESKFAMKKLKYFSKKHPIRFSMNFKIKIRFKNNYIDHQLNIRVWKMICVLFNIFMSSILCMLLFFSLAMLNYHTDIINRISVSFVFASWISILETLSIVFVCWLLIFKFMKSQIRTLIRDFKN